MPPRRPPGLEERVSALEDHADTTEERVFGDLGQVLATQRETNDRLSRVEARLELALDKERAVTDAEIAGLAKRLGELTRRTADDKREMLRRLDEIDRDVEASGQQGRDTLTSVQREVARQEAENALALANAEAARLKAENAKQAADLAKADQRAHELKTRAFWLAVSVFLAVVAFLLIWLLGDRRLPEKPPPQRAERAALVDQAR